MTITVNGDEHPLEGTPVHTNLLDFLRGAGFTGAKEGCAEGECGACSVLVARPDSSRAGGSRWVALNACLVPAAAYESQEIVTAEGLGDPTHLHPVQEAMALGGGSQCGYCTPGFVCSMAAEYYRADRLPPDRSSEVETLPGRSSEPPPGRSSDTTPGWSSDTTPGWSSEVETPEHGPNGFDLHALSGNLCRCTGYRPIRDAAYALGSPAADDPFVRRCARPAPPAGPVERKDATGRFVRPADLTAALAILADEPAAVLVAGSTDWGVDVNLKGARAGLVVAIDRLEELRGFAVTDDAVELGAALTLSECERLLDGRVPLLDEVWPQFASRLIRNGATLGGNLGTGSPIGDTPPALLALEATVVLASAQGEREAPLAEYFTGYRQSVRRTTELIRAVRIPLPLSRTTAFHKIAKRRFDDISSVAVAFALDVEDGQIRKARVGLGGVAATPLRATRTEQALEGRPWTAATIEEAAAVLRSEGTPIDDQRASAAYRTAMLGQALRKLHAEHGGRAESRPPTDPGDRAESRPGGRPDPTPDGRAESRP